MFPRLRYFLGTPAAPMQIVTALCLAAIAYMIMGCGIYMPGAGLAALGTQYHHAEYDPATGEKIWETTLFRSWGTSRANTYVDTESERIGIEGEGMSDNMQRSVGDDAVEKVADVVSKNLRPGAQLEDGLTPDLVGK